jgi:hypothetical protein
VVHVGAVRTAIQRPTATPMGTEASLVKVAIFSRMSRNATARLPASLPELLERPVRVS